jgi:hypothetical protein
VSTRSLGVGKEYRERVCKCSTHLFYVAGAPLHASTAPIQAVGKEHWRPDEEEHAIRCALLQGRTQGGMVLHACLSCCADHTCDLGAGSSKQDSMQLACLGCSQGRVCCANPCSMASCCRVCFVVRFVVACCCVPAGAGCSCVPFGGGKGEGGQEAAAAGGVSCVSLHTAGSCILVPQGAIPVRLVTQWKVPRVRESGTPGGAGS